MVNKINTKKRQLRPFRINKAWMKVAKKFKHHRKKNLLTKQGSLLGIHKHKWTQS